MREARGWGWHLGRGPALFKEASLPFSFKDIPNPKWSFVVMGTRAAKDPVDGVQPLFDFTSKQCLVYHPAKDGSPAEVTAASPVEWARYKHYRVREALPELGATFVQRPTLELVSTMSLQQYLQRYYFPLRFVNSTERDINYSRLSRVASDIATMPSPHFWEEYLGDPVYYDFQSHTVMRVDPASNTVLRHTNANEPYITTLFVTDALYLLRLHKAGPYLAAASPCVMKALGSGASSQDLELLEDFKLEAEDFHKVLYNTLGASTPLDFKPRVITRPHRDFLSFEPSYVSDSVNQWVSYIRGDSIHPL